MPFTLTVFYVVDKLQVKKGVLRKTLPFLPSPPPTRWFLPCPALVQNILWENYLGKRIVTEQPRVQEWAIVSSTAKLLPSEIVERGVPGFLMWCFSLYSLSPGTQMTPHSQASCLSALLLWVLRLSFTHSPPLCVQGYTDKIPSHLLVCTLCFQMMITVCLELDRTVVHDIRWRDHLQ